MGKSHKYCVSIFIIRKNFYFQSLSWKWPSELLMKIYFTKFKFRGNLRGLKKLSNRFKVKEIIDCALYWEFECRLAISIHVNTFKKIIWMRSWSQIGTHCCSQLQTICEEIWWQLKEHQLFVNFVCLLSDKKVSSHQK